MEHKDAFLLETIVDYCNRIQTVLAKVDGEKSLYNDIYAQDLCSFYCLQIGETVKSLSDAFTDKYCGIPWHKISGFRNIIAHEYGNVDAETLWKTISQNIPELKSFCEKLIK